MNLLLLTARELRQFVRRQNAAVMSGLGCRAQPLRVTGPELRPEGRKEGRKGGREGKRGEQEVGEKI